MLEQSGNWVRSLSVPMHLGKRTHLHFPYRGPIDRRDLFYISLRFRKKQGLLIKHLIYISQSRARSLSSMFPQGAYMETAALFPHPIVHSLIHSFIHSQSVNRFMVASVLTGQGIWRYVVYVCWHRVPWYRGTYGSALKVCLLGSCLLKQHMWR